MSEEQALSDLRDKVIGAAIAATIGGALVGIALAGRLSLRLRRGCCNGREGGSRRSGRPRERQGPR